MTTKAKNRLSQSYQSSPCFIRRLPSVASGKQYYEVHDGVFNWAGSTLAVPDFGPVYGVHLKDLHGSAAPGTGQRVDLVDRESVV